MHRIQLLALVKLVAPDTAVSTELLNQHYKPRTGAKVQPEAKRVQTHNTTPSDAPQTESTTDAKQVQSELITHLQKEVAHLQNANVQLNERLKENNYIIANLTKQIAPPPPPTDTPGPKPNTTTDVPFLWFIVGLVFGIVVIGLVVFYSGL